MYQKNILNDRKLWFVLCLIFILNIAGCSGQKTDIESETSWISAETVSETEIETESVSASEVIETSVKKMILRIRIY